MKVLIAEDDKFLANAYKMKLTKAGYDIQIARDGQEALEVMRQFQPDLVLLDLIMPNMDGFEFLEHVQADDMLKTVPIIVASNLGQSEDVKKAQSLGAKDYVVKSDLSLEELIAKVESFAPKKEA